LDNAENVTFCQICLDFLRVFGDHFNFLFLFAELRLPHRNSNSQT
jgi:hypothetical protein